MPKVTFAERETRWLNKEKALCLFLAVGLVAVFVKYLVGGLALAPLESANDDRERPRLCNLVAADPPYAFDGPQSLYPGRRWRPTPFEYEKPPIRLTCRISASALGGPPPLTVSFNYKIDGGSGEYLIRWEFGDGTPGAEGPEPPQHVYRSTGVYTVRLTVTDGEGARAVQQAQIRVSERALPPLRVTLTARPSEGLAPLAVELQARGSGGSPPYDYAWEFGDGATGEGERVSHVFRNPGNYNARLTARDRDGREVATNTVLRVLSPRATASPTPLQPTATSRPLAVPPEFPVSVSGVIQGPGPDGRWIALLVVKADQRVIRAGEGDELQVGEFHLRVEKILPSRVDFRNIKTGILTRIYVSRMLAPPAG